MFPSPRMDLHSSHWDYLHPRQATPWLEQSLTLSYFQGSQNPRTELDRFVLRGIPDELEKILSSKKWPAILGIKSFVATIREKYLISQRINSELPQKNSLLKTKALPSKLILKIVDETYQDMDSGIEKRWACMYFLQRFGFLKLKEIGLVMNGISYKAVQQYLRRYHFQSTFTVSLAEERLLKEM